MPRFAANLPMLFCGHPMLERFAASRAAGFDRVEILFPYDVNGAAAGWHTPAARTEDGLEWTRF
jgi:hydroxypyruvate isomerase